MPGRVHHELEPESECKLARFDRGMARNEARLDVLVTNGKGLRGDGGLQKKHQRREDEGKKSKRCHIGKGRREKLG